METYYKVISKDNKSFHGGNFDWTKYLPKGKRKGKWTPKIVDISKCHRAYHVTQYWNMWYEQDARIFECECDGKYQDNVIGVDVKAVFCRIRLVREIFPQFKQYSNTGSWNTGDCNTGYRNTGDSNTGDRNTGNWNTGDRNTGFFNTITPKNVLVFNKPCSCALWTNTVKPDFIFFEQTSLDQKEDWRKAYNNSDKNDKLKLVNLPNFDVDVFCEISGILVDAKTGIEIK